MSFAYHVTVGVSSLAQSKTFYDGMFSQLGWAVHHEDDESKAYASGDFNYWIIPAETSEPNRQNDGVGYNHLAIQVESKEAVDQLSEWLHSIDATIDIEPKAYHDYSENYYAVFFFDPDGTRLEVATL